MVISEKMSRWLSIAANIGILSGLLLVSYELNQNTTLARIDLVSGANVYSNEVFAHTLGEEPAEIVARSFECPEKMEFSDCLIIDTWLYTTMYSFYCSYELAQEGLFSEQDWKASVERYANWYLATGFGQIWWNETGRHFFDKTFVEYADLQLEKGG